MTVEGTTQEPVGAPVVVGDGRGRIHLFDRGPRIAVAVFAAVEAVALGVYLRAGRTRWFFHDEWGYLITLDGGDVDDLLRPDNEHWTTLPRVVYRILFNVFGLTSYVPYQLVAIALHLATAALMRIVMRRAGVSPWMATIVAGVFVLLGSGDHNIIRAFQMTFGGALAFGFVHLLSSDHDGPIDRRDALGLLAGLAALMCSGVGIAMVIAVVAAAALRRGWRAALFHALPLGAAYLAWWMAYASDSVRRDQPGAGRLVSFVARAVSATFEAVSQHTPAAVALGGLLVAGALLVWRRPDGGPLRSRYAAPAGLVIGALAFAGLTAWSRAVLGTDFATQSRYVHVLAALVLPAVAVAADAVVRRYEVLVVPVALLLLVGVPGNLDTTWNQTGRGRGDRGDREVYLAFAEVPVARDAPDWVRPDPTAAPELTLGWLRDARADGHLPAVGPIDPKIAAEATLRHALQQVAPPARLTDCSPLTEPAERRLEPGQWIGFTGDLRVFDATVPRRERAILELQGGRRSALTVLHRPLDLVIGPDPPAAPPQLCAIGTPG